MKKRTAEESDQPSLYTGAPKVKSRRSKIIGPLLAMALAAGAVAFGSDKAVTAADQLATCTINTDAMVPAQGTMLGVNLDWERTPLNEHRANLGHAPSVVVQFSDIPYDAATWEHTVNAAEQVREHGAILLLTLEPHAGLESMSQEVINRLAHDLRELNEAGTPVIIRFAHEMNGSWYAWGQQPARYVETYRDVARAIYATAPATQMMWAPNYGGGYPFTGGQFAAVPGTGDYEALDTDGDGVLTMADDSYAPYYPGDEYVDWAGISLYHWGNQRPWGNNEIPEDTKFADMLTGDYNGTAGDDAAIPDFYQVYGVDHGLPIAIPETAAIYTPSRSGASEVDIKRAWWQQVFSEEFHAQHPQVKMVNWFEWEKYEVEIDDTVDWRAADSPSARDAFRNDLPDWVVHADEMDLCS